MGERKAGVVIRPCNGTVLGDAGVCMRYLEKAYPQNPLFGSTPVESGIVDMW